MIDTITVPKLQDFLWKTRMQFNYCGHSTRIGWTPSPKIVSDTETDVTIHTKEYTYGYLHIMILPRRAGKSPKEIQKGFERTGKGVGLDFIVIKGWHWGKSSYAQRGSGMHGLNFLLAPKERTPIIFTNFPKMWDRRSRGRWQSSHAVTKYHKWNQVLYCNISLKFEDWNVLCFI